MYLKEIIKSTLRQHLNEQKIINERWFHGTPDSREIEKQGGFTHKTMRVDYVKDLEKFKEIKQKMIEAREDGDENLYFKLLDLMPKFKKYYEYKKPLFLTNKYPVAKTYADPKRAFDYQSAIEKVYEVNVDCEKIVKIDATGDRFAFINPNKVKKGFINAGIPEDDIDRTISMFNYYISDNEGIKTDVIAAIGNWFDFDCIDVIGVLDSYHGGKIKSTVRMVLDPTKVKIKKFGSQPIKESLEKMHGWHQSFKEKYYPSIESAKNDIRRAVNHNNKQFSAIFGEDNPEEIVGLFNFIETNKGFKIMPKQPKRTKKKKIDWGDFDLIKTPLDELHLIASSNFLDYEIDNKPSIIKIDEYIDDDNYFDHKNRIINLSKEIIKNMKFEPIVVEPNKKYVIEGQHRIRAMKLLGFKTVMAYKIIEN
jgi:hypothetical protein